MSEYATGVISLDDLPVLTSDEWDGNVDPLANNFSLLPDAVYEARLTLGTLYGTDKQLEAKQTASGKDYIRFSVKATIIAGEYENRSIFSQETTMVSSKKTTRAAQILAAAGVPLKRIKAPHTEQARQVADILSSEPLVRIRTQWTAKYKNSDGEYVDLYKPGMRNFPQTENGVYISSGPLLEHPEDGSPVTVRVTIAAYMPLTTE